MRQTTIELDPELMQRLAALPDAKCGRTSIEPTPAQLVGLRAAWNRKPKAQVAEALGVSENTARRWVRKYGLEE